MITTFSNDMKKFFLDVAGLVSASAKKERTKIDIREYFDSAVKADPDSKLGRVSRLMLCKAAMKEIGDVETDQPYVETLNITKEQFDSYLPH
jgi:hypothetical protein